MSWLAILIVLLFSLNLWAATTISGKVTVSKATVGTAPTASNILLIGGGNLLFVNGGQILKVNP